MSSLGNINLTLSPEELKKGKNSIKSYIWILAIIIYYMLFNEFPYNGDIEFQLNNDIHSNKK
jgi:serine/threonine protein kinase